MYITAPPIEQCGQYLKNFSLLYVEDEEEVRTLFSKLIERRVGKLLTASNGQEGLEMFREHRPDLVITDMAMPNLTVDALATECMRLRPDLPVILCTGFSERINEEKALALGVKAFILKPLVMRELAIIIRKVLDGKI